ncbi:hypothetical protein [Methyloceanibacter sp.]|uniref:hypothetical protein n=1 Tax=Methyloceanibacter sp. TaxID=1965321 RepID=UPI002B7033BD|nr:hypothetical protein [Methyloceanibacter sp.]HML93404.1 hypothetical protein [Methyloceanibacter sp.]
MDVKFPGQAQQGAQDFDSRANAIDAAALSLIGDETMRERAAIQFKVSRERLRNRLTVKQAAKEKDARKASVLESLDAYQKIFLSEDIDVTERMEAWTDLEAATVAAHNSGVFSEMESLNVADKYVAGTAGKFADILKATNVDHLAIELDDKEGPLSRLDPVKRANLRAHVVKEGQLNGLLVDIMDGKAGAADIQNARNDGWLREYGDIRRANAALEEYTKAGTFADAHAAFADGAKVWDPTDTDDRKRIDALIESRDGVKALYNGDPEFFERDLAPLIDQTGMIPGSVEGTLEGMLRSNDPKRVIPALETLDQMERLNPTAFARDIKESLTKKLARYREQSAYRSPEDIVAGFALSDDPSMAEARKKLAKDGAKLAADVSDETILDHFDPSIFVAGPDAPFDPLANAQLRAEFNQLYTDEYAATGDSSAAEKSALALLDRAWGQTEVGGERRLMRYPPEKYFPTINGTHDWMAEQATAELAPYLQGTDGFSLVGDARTQSEIARKQRPTYSVVVKDENGVFSTLPVRFTFDASPYAQKRRVEFEAKHQQRREDLKVGEGVVPAL